VCQKLPTLFWMEGWDASCDISHLRKEDVSCENIPHSRKEDVVCQTLFWMEG
jgi:hypothetical protein